MTVFGLSGEMLPAVLAVAFAGVVWGLRSVSTRWQEPPLDAWEKALIGYAAVVGLLRLAPYAWQYAAGVLVAPVTWDDNWHFQEVASLVNAERFPPRLNFAPEAYFHFYYVAWVPAAAISALIKTATGVPMIKLGYGLGALLLNLAIAWSLIIAIRHLVPRQGRGWALGALLIAGAAVDGLFALRYLVVLGHLQHAEWWQAGLLVMNSFSALSTSMIWVPHHLAGGIAVLLAVVVATEPVTLAPRAGNGPFVIAGLLLGAAAYCSIFAFAGGVIVFLPLAWEVLRGRERARAAALAAAFAIPAVPLAYIYLGADARGGFVLGQAFRAWAAATGSTAMGVNGVLLAFVFMVLEVGWLYVVGKGLDGGGTEAARMRTIAATAAVMLASTAAIGFSGSNNWALRATIVPAVVLAAGVGRGMARGGGRLHPATMAKAGAVALALAGVAHLNETALLVGASARSAAFAAETAACKSAIVQRNSGSGGSASAILELCRDPLSAYHLETSFTKSPLTAIDRELMGRGFGFLGGR